MAISKDKGTSNVVLASIVIAQDPKTGAVYLTQLSTMSLPTILLNALALVASGVGIASHIDALGNEDAQKRLQEQKDQEANAEKQADILDNLGGGYDYISDALLADRPLGIPNPMDPSTYFELADNMSNIGTELFDVDNYLNTDTLLPGTST